MMHCLMKTHENRRVKLIDTLRGGKKGRKRCKTRVQNCQQERKGSPRASAGRAVGASGEELPEDLPGKKHLRADDTIWVWCWKCQWSGCHSKNKAGERNTIKLFIVFWTDTWNSHRLPVSHHDTEKHFHVTIPPYTQTWNSIVTHASEKAL